jgi:hypothetical protein
MRWRLFIFALLALIGLGLVGTNLMRVWASGPVDLLTLLEGSTQLQSDPTGTILRSQPVQVNLLAGAGRGRG